MNTDQPDELQKAIHEAAFVERFNGITVPMVTSRADIFDSLLSAAKQLRQVEKEKQSMGIQLDHLLAHCKDSECEECSKIICPHQEPLHFHHDGCPSCVTFEQMQQERDQLKAALEKCARALNNSKSQFQNILDYHALYHASDERKLIAEIKDINEALSNPTIQSILKQQSEVTTQCHPQTKPNVT